MFYFVSLIYMKIKNGIRYEKNGWIYLSIYGEPYKRGYAHGHLVAPELAQIMKMLEFFLYEEYGRTFAFFCEVADDFFRPQIEAHFPEFYEEMRGIADGAKQPLRKIVFWNCFVSFALSEISFFSVSRSFAAPSKS